MRLALGHTGSGCGCLYPRGLTTAPGSAPGLGPQPQSTCKDAAKAEDRQHSAIGQERDGAKGGPRFSVTRTKAVDAVLLADSKPFCNARALPWQVPFLT